MDDKEVDSFILSSTNYDAIYYNKAQNIGTLKQNDFCWSLMKMLMGGQCYNY